MSVATYIEPIVGWRCWRVMPVETLDRGKRYRLCAAGTYGIPKLWEPRRAVVAHCSDFKARHEAPHRDHTCGIHAYSSRDDAECHLAQFVRTNGKQGVSWALGRASLWGRVIEHEQGWRAQYAYPYDVTVFTDGTAPIGVGSEYAIDVDVRPRSELRALVAQHPGDDSTKWVKLISGWYDADWYYGPGLYGYMDRTFLRPYHEDLCKRLEELSKEVRSLQRSVEAGGRDDAR